MERHVDTLNRPWCGGVGQRRRGFTLIELLVVIAIIALLVSILMPSLARAKEAAKTATCAADERSLSLGMTMYVSEYQGNLPWFYSSYYDLLWFGGNPALYTEGRFGAASWHTLIYPYVNNADIYACAAYPAEGARPASGTYNGRTYVVNSHYRANPYLGWSRSWPGGDSSGDYNPLPYVGGGIVEDGTFNPVNMERVKNPATKVLLFDCAWYPLYGSLVYTTTPAVGRQCWTNATGDGDRTKPANYTPDYDMPNIGSHHRKNANFTLLDGHVELLLPSDPRSFGGGMPEDYDRRHWKLDKGAL